MRVTRRSALQGAMATAAMALASRHAASAAAASQPQILRTIPSTGEKIPVVGIGTNAYDVTTAEDLAARKAVLQAMPGLGASVIDSARGYGRSEQVIGQLLAELGTRDRFFIATKPVSAPQADAVINKALLDESFSSLRVSRIDLLQIHSFVRLDELMPLFLEYKQAKRIRYIGVTTSTERTHQQLMEAMRRHPFDFIQVNYSIDDRSAADQVLPLAQQKGMAVLNNVPLGGSRGSLFPLVAGKSLPPWAAEFGATTWAQYMLKFNLAHPAITAAIPGTTTLAHLQDNQAAGRGDLPDAAMVRRMAAHWDDELAARATPR